jgi:aryl-alcohol dehydrogenase-like predicted oxidoreductase
MRTRALGKTGLSVSELGLGAGPLGGDDIDDATAVALIIGAVDRGVTLIDTAPSYGRSEVRIGMALRRLDRERVTLSTKLGYGVPGVPDWTGECIARGVDAALERIGTDRIDIAHLHSCPLEVLQRGEVIDALERCVRAGKVRVAAYSGDNAELAWAVASERFGVVQCSVSVVDQRALESSVPLAFDAGIGVLAKRPLANGVWRETKRPDAPDRAVYWDRLRQMDVRIDAAQAIGFVLAHDSIACALLGTTSLAHMQAMIDVVQISEIDRARVERIRSAFQRCGAGWDGVI